MSKKVFFFYAIIILSVRRSYGIDCLCQCQNKEVCDELTGLRRSVDANISDRRKWNQHFTFVKDFHQNWQEKVTKIFEEVLANTERQCVERNGEKCRRPKFSEDITQSDSKLAFDFGKKIKKKYSKIEKKLREVQFNWTRNQEQLRSEIDDVVLNTLTDVGELTEKIVHIGADLRMAKNQAETLETALSEEREKGENLKDDLQQVKLGTIKRNQILLSMMGSFEEKIRALLDETKYLKDNLLVEQVERQKLEKKTEGIWKSLIEFSEQLYKLLSVTKPSERHEADVKNVRNFFGNFTLSAYETNVREDKGRQSRKPADYRQKQDNTEDNKACDTIVSKVETLEGTVKHVRGVLRGLSTRIKALESKCSGVKNYK